MEHHKLPNSRRERSPSLPFLAIESLCDQTSHLPSPSLSFATCELRLKTRVLLGVCVLQAGRCHQEGSRVESRLNWATWDPKKSLEMQLKPRWPAASIHVGTSGPRLNSSEELSGLLSVRHLEG